MHRTRIAHTSYTYTCVIYTHHAHTRTYHSLIRHMHTYTVHTHHIHPSIHHVPMHTSYIHVHHIHTHASPERWRHWEDGLRGNNRRGSEFKRECVRFKMPDPWMGLPGEVGRRSFNTHVRTYTDTRVHMPQAHQSYPSLPIIAVLILLLQRTMKSSYLKHIEHAIVMTCVPPVPGGEEALLSEMGHSSVFPKHRSCVCLPNVH